MSYPERHTGTRPDLLCPHTYTDAQNVCLDCSVYIPAPQAAGELCIYCNSDSQSEGQAPYCSVFCAIAAQEG
jgi:hypothetical protein